MVEHDKMIKSEGQILFKLNLADSSRVITPIGKYMLLKVKESYNLKKSQFW